MLKYKQIKASRSFPFTIQAKYVAIFALFALDRALHDVRNRRHEYTLDTHSFQFTRHITRTEDFKDRTVVEESYIPEMERLLQQHLSEKTDQEVVRTVCFDFRVCFGLNHLGFVA